LIKEQEKPQACNFAGMTGVIMNPHNDLFDLLNALNTALNVSDAWQAGLVFFQKYGGTQISYARGRQDGSIAFLTTVPDWWRNRYLENNYVSLDPFADISRACFAPTRFDTKSGTFPISLSEPATQMLQEYTETGANAGFVIPTMTPSTVQISGFNIANAMNQQEFSLFYRDRENALVLAAHAVHQRCQELDPSSQTDAYLAPQEMGHYAPLSPRERECLLWLCKGMRNDAIADRMGITRVTVEMHLRNCRQKLNARTREQAVVTAIKRGFITP
jgi:DNA-binding CsgD family transcriptional regulator